MSSERLESCEDELKVLLEEIQRSITYQLPRKDADENRRTLQLLEKNLDKAEALLREFQTEMRMAPRSYQQELINRIGYYRADLASLRRQVNSGSSAREELFSRQQDEEDDNAYGDYNDPEKQMLLKNTKTLKRASQSLYRAKQVSAQTDEVGNEIVEELHEQKGALVRTRNRLVDVDEDLNRTTTLLKTLACKSIQNRLCLIGIIIIEILILAIVLTVKIVLLKK